MSPRELLIDCYRAALAAVDARECVRTSLERRPPARARWHLVAVGKAAGAMAQGAVEALGDTLEGGCIVLPAGHLPPGFAPARHGLEVWVGAHPVPDERSLAAGERVAEFVDARGPDDALLFLVSGGASSLVEWLVPGCALADLQALNQSALATGVPIERLNAERSRLSRLKGGGLARLAGGRRSLALMISDVPRDDPRVIGSGLLHGSPEQGRHGPGVPVRMVASLGRARRAAASAALRHGLAVRAIARRVEGDAAATGRRLAQRIARAPAGTLLAWGGEPVVTLPHEPGRGGRCQHLALAAALELERRGARGACLLAAGTDGIDGASCDAGAIVDARTCQRGRDGGFDPHVSLARADSGSFLEAAGDLLHTGPTLTNVGDLVLGLTLQEAT